MVDVVVGEIMMKFQEMQLFILDFYEILYYISNYLPFLLNESFIRNSKYQYNSKFHLQI